MLMTYINLLPLVDLGSRKLHPLPQKKNGCGTPHLLAVRVVLIGTTPIPGGTLSLGFFEMYYLMAGSSAKLDQ